jgi:hypothetical protein
MRYAERRASAISWVVDRREDFGAGDDGERYGRNFMRQSDSNEMPAAMSYWGASRCQPMGEPGRYSLMSAIANASASTPAHCAIVARSGNKNAGSGPAAPRSYDWPKKATRRRATTPRTLEVRERDTGNGVQQGSLTGLCDEALAILEAWREIVIEQAR